MELLISSLVGGIIGLFLGIMFEESLQIAKNRLIKQIRTIITRPRFTIREPDTFSLGKHNTSFLVIDGDGEIAYTPETIICRVEKPATPLPAEIIKLYEAIEKREHQKRENGLQAQWNGPLYALDRYAIDRTIPNEDMKVTFTFRPTNYFTFQATVMSLDVNLVTPPATFTIRQKYLQSHDLSLPIPFLANGFGITLVIVTGDKKLLLTRRHDTIGARAGELDISFAEGVHPYYDLSSSYRGRPDLYRTAIRGTQEELGIELVQEEITFLGFGVDIEYYQWGLLGVARISETAVQALEKRKRGTGGKWETKKLEIIEFNPRSVLSYLKQERIWSTGLVAVYWALVHEYDRKRVDAAVREIFS